MSCLPDILAFKLTNYKGGDNPILIYIFVICVIIGLGASIWVYYKRWSLRRHFYSLCADKKLTSSQVEVFVHFMQMHKIPLSPQILTNRVHFDKFINSVGYHIIAVHESQSLADQDLSILIDLRKSLFPTRGKEVSTSRCLKAGASLLISFFDEKKGTYSRFNSSILENTDCGLKVSVEEVPGVGQVIEKNPLSIQFREGSMMHLKVFESYLMRKEMKENQITWLIQHSYFVKNESRKEINISGKLYIAKTDVVEEISVTLTTLEMNGCELVESGLEDGKKAILQVMLLDRECNISVHIHQGEGGVSYLTFSALDDEVRAQIRKAMR
jgi:hypothetical protein